MKEKGFWEGVQAAMPTALGYVSIGLACGIIGAPYVTPVEMGLMSLFVYAGSAQFAMLALIAVQAPVAAIAMTVFLINLRLFCWACMHRPISVILVSGKISVCLAS